MRSRLRWIGLLGSFGLLLGSAFGFVVAVSSDCHIDSDGSVPAGACVRFVGMYLSAVTTYVSAGAVVGAALGVAVGTFIAVPLLHRRQRDPSTTVHPLEVPAIWFGLQLLELLVLIPALLFWVPDPGVWPEAARVSAWIVALLGVTAMNYAIRRRFIPR